MKKIIIVSLVISSIITVIVGFIFNYCALPAWNIHSEGLWMFFIVEFLIFASIYSVSCMIAMDDDCYAFGWIPFGLAVIVFLILLFGSSSLFQHQKLANIAQKEIGDWNTDMEAVENVSNIALMDTETAKVFGERKLGSLSDLVSQYDLSTSYTQINYQGSPMKVAPLEYDNFWKWNSNKVNGIPGYIIVDPVNTNATFIRLEKPIKYSPSERFGRDLKRTLRREYPSYIFNNIYFEIDEEGNPYWVASVVEPTAGLFGGKVITGAVILDACTGESQYYIPEEIPDWVDVVYDGDYITQCLDWNGMLKNGFWNSMFSAQGCTKCTNDYGYVTIGSDIWIYTGITSATADSSNIGVVLANERTFEIKYYEIAGADEKSAMAAAEGEVQQFGYVASFPSIINVNGEATYIMVLKDANNIVKEYAMVNVANYSKVVVAESQEEVFDKYAKKMGFYDLISEDVAVEEDNKEIVEEEVGALIDVQITVDTVQFIVNNGNTTVYISSADGKNYKSVFDEFWILVKIGDTVNAQYAETDAENEIVLLRNFSK